MLGIAFFHFISWITRRTLILENQNQVTFVLVVIPCYGGINGKTMQSNFKC